MSDRLRSQRLRAQQVQVLQNLRISLEKEEREYHINVEMYGVLFRSS